MLNAYYNKMLAKMKADGFEINRVKEVEAKLAEIHKSCRYLFIEYKLSKINE